MAEEVRLWEKKSSTKQEAGRSFDGKLERKMNDPSTSGA